MEKIYNKTMELFNVTDFSDMHFTMALCSWIILPIAFPLLCVAIYGLLTQIKNDHVGPVYVINLLISDVFMICAKPIVLSIKLGGITHELMVWTYRIGLQASTIFMVVIAAERYTMIAHPLWYRFHRTITKSILCSLVAWMATLVIVGSIVVAFVTEVIDIEETMFVGMIVLCLLPYPFVIFFFVGSLRALSKSMSVSPHGQQRVMGTLALVLFIYTVLFLPYIVMMLLMKASPWLFREKIFQYFGVVSSTFLSLNPLFDPILYVFATKKKSFILPCCRCRRYGQQGQPQIGDTEFATSIRTGRAHS